MDHNNDYIPPFGNNDEITTPDENPSDVSEATNNELSNVTEANSNEPSNVTEASSSEPSNADGAFYSDTAPTDSEQDSTSDFEFDSDSTSTNTSYNASHTEWEPVPEIPGYERASFSNTSFNESSNPFEQERQFNTSRSFENYSYDPSQLRSFDRKSTNDNGGNPKPKSKKSPAYITKKAFIICLICAMLGTSGITIGGLKLAGAFNGSSGGNHISATDYKLTKSTGTTRPVKEIVSMNENAVVEIQTEKSSGDSWIKNYVTKGAGSGVIIDSDGYIMTCNHVIDGASNIIVKLKDGTTKKARVVGADSQSDIAVLKIDGSGYTAAKYGDSDSISVGDQAVAIGNPLGELGGSVSAGIISARDRQIEVDGKTMKLLQTDTSINPGNSGGGLFDGQGNLIGIVVAKSSGSNVEGLGFAIPINTASKIAKDLIQNGKVTGRAMIGVKIVDLTKTEDAQKYGVNTPGVYIDDVVSNQAKQAGLKSGDMIQSVGKTKITSASSLRTELDKYKPGDRVKITVLRNEKSVEITLVLSEG